MNEETKTQIYVACLGSYNNGILHGRWIDATQDIEAISAEIDDMLSESSAEPAEDYAIHDYEGFGDIYIPEYSGIEFICELAELITEHGEELISGLYNYYSDLDEVKTAVTERYCGEYDSEVDFATLLFDECYAHKIPENLRFYIDYERFARDLFMCDYISVDSGAGVYIISCC